MTYDPVDTNDDGVVDADVDNESVNTDEVTNESGLTISRTALEAQTPIIEDWERQTTDYLSVDIGSFSITTSTVLQGSAALRGDGEVRTPHKTRRGFRYQFYIYFEDTGGSSTRDQWIGFSTQENTFFRNGDGYYILIRGENDEIRIGRYDGETGSTLASATPTLPKSEFLRVEVEIQYDDIRLAVYQRDGTQVGTEISSNDGTYTQNFFVQLKHDNRNSGDEIIIDEIKRSVI